MSFSRVAAVVVAAVAAVMVPAGAALASTTPDTWANPPQMSTLQAIGMFAGIPIGLALVIAVVGYWAASKGYNHEVPIAEAEASAELEPGGEPSPTIDSLTEHRS